mgnify:CR=1 FL=1
MKFNQSVEEASMNIEKNERLLNEAMREMEADMGVLSGC